MNENKNSDDKYIKFIEVGLKTVQSSRLNLYSCKFSKRNYTQHQHFALILLKQYTGIDYRGIIELVDLMSKVKQALGQDQVPHFTTLTVSIQHKQKNYKFILAEIEDFYKAEISMIPFLYWATPLSNGLVYICLIIGCFGLAVVAYELIDKLWSVSVSSQRVN